MVRPFSCGGLSRYDRTEARISSVERGSALQVHSPDGRYIVFDSLSADGHIGLLDLDSGTVTDLGEGFFPRWSPDGTRIAFGMLDEEGGSDLYTMAADGSDRNRLTSDPEFDTGPQWSPDGTTID